VGEIDDDPRQSDIRDVLTEIQQSGKVGITNRERVGICMKHFAARGTPLSTLATSKYLGRSVSTLKGYARDLKLRFPDYVPDSLKTKSEKKRSRK